MACFMDRTMLVRLSGCLLVLSACNPRLFDRLDTEDASLRSATDADIGKNDGDGDLDASGGGRRGEPEDAGGSDGSDAGTDGGSEDASVAEPACPPVHPEGHAFEVASVTNAGTFPVPEGAVNRVVGPSVRMDDRIVWTFPSGGLTDPENMGFAATAHADPAHPLELNDVVEDAHPRAVLHLTPEEGTQKLSLLSASVIPLSSSEAWLFFQKHFIVKAVGVGVARLEADGQAERVGDLFADEDVDRFSVGGFADEGYVYLYGLLHGGLVRAPLEEANAEASYEAYVEPNTWTPDLTQATRVLPEAGPNTFSVSPNRYLGGVLLVRSRPESDAIELFRSDKPQGPFEPFGLIETEASRAPEVFTQQVIEHVALREACDQQIFISYLLPHESKFVEELDIFVPTRSETRFLSVDLQ